MIIFLDFDGVLHPYGVPEGPQCFTQIPVLGQLLEALPQARVVLSTTWRTSHGLEACKAFFPREFADRVIDATADRVDNTEIPDTLWNYVREAQCWHWMRNNASADAPWVALDDEPWRFSPFCKKLYLTDPNTGLVGADIGRIVEVSKCL